MQMSQRRCNRARRPANILSEQPLAALGPRSWDTAQPSALRCWEGHRGGAVPAFYSVLGTQPLWFPAQVRGTPRTEKLSDSPKRFTELREGMVPTSLSSGGAA